MKFISITTVLAVTSFTNSLIYANPSNSPLGYWRTIDDVTNEPKSIILLEGNDNQITGKVVKILKLDNPSENPETKVCDKCKGKRHNKPIKGMVILWGVSKEGDNEWGGGEILDPKTGKTYSVTLELDNNGKSLNVRGYIGISLLGRTQTWERTTAP
ncbi:MAG: DUF2147 domain-containing protein [Gammaproteobacteria bacterium]|nr:DUF2147 domain-containing protein [Gammaproteobacteria bacterium]